VKLDFIARKVRLDNIAESAVKCIDYLQSPEENRIQFFLHETKSNTPAYLHIHPNQMKKLTLFFENTVYGRNHSTVRSR
jgi:hypothetical protein